MTSGGSTEGSARPGRRRSSITLLHVSDVQFGRYHAFGHSGMTEADRELDSLFSRLHADIDDLRRSQGLVPEVVVLSGDLAEWALPCVVDHADVMLSDVCSY